MWISTTPWICQLLSSRVSFLNSPTIGEVASELTISSLSPPPPSPCSLVLMDHSNLNAEFASRYRVSECHDLWAIKLFIYWCVKKCLKVCEMRSCSTRVKMPVTHCHIWVINVMCQSNDISDNIYTRHVIVLTVALDWLMTLM